MHVTPPGCYVNHCIKSTRNQAMECCKFIASLFVVLIHAPFPGKLGGIINCFGSFAVPTFFMISGYFNYQANSEQIVRRIKHIVNLLLLGTCFHIVWNCVATELTGGSTIAYLRAAIPDPDEIVKWLVLHIHPYAGHLWYLNALIACYIVFYVFTAFSSKQAVNYRAFYSLCFNLFAITFAFDTVASACGNLETGLFARCGWFVGLPMFALGLFIREHQDHIFSSFHFSPQKLILFVALGAVFNVLQWDTVGIGVIPFGTLIGTLALMLLLVTKPIIIVKSQILTKIVLAMGPISTYIYLTHLVFIMLYDQFLRESAAACCGIWEPYLYPIIIVIFSLCTAVLCNILSHFLRQVFLRKKSK